MIYDEIKIVNRVGFLHAKPLAQPHLPERQNHSLGIHRPQHLNMLFK